MSRKPDFVSQEDWDAYEADMELFAAEDPGPDEDTLERMRVEYEADRAFLFDSPYEGEEALFEECDRNVKGISLSPSELMSQAMDLNEPYDSRYQKEASLWVESELLFATLNQESSLSMADADEAYRQSEPIADSDGLAAYQERALHSGLLPDEQRAQAKQAYENRIEAVFSDVYEANRMLQESESESLRGRKRSNGSLPSPAVVTDATQKYLNELGYEQFEQKRFQQFLEQKRLEHVSGLQFDATKKAPDVSMEKTAEKQAEVSVPERNADRLPEDNNYTPAGAKISQRAVPGDDWSFDETDSDDTPDY